MMVQKMNVLNDDGLLLDLSTVFILFLMPNFTLILLTTLNAYLLHASKKYSRLNYSLGKLANFFAKGALDRIIRNMLRHFETKKLQHEEQIPMTPRRRFSMRTSSYISKNLPSTTSSFTAEKNYDPNYLLLIPFQMDLLLTVFVYKILTRDVYPETCQSYLTTYHNRPEQVVCWLRNINSNITNLSNNLTLYHYCTNQSITYINYEHNDVICTQYVFKLINIIDTVTNMFAWQQAVVFVVTKSIVFSYWYQQKLRKTSCWSNLSDHHHRIILFIAIGSVLFIYILLFVFILPIRFYLMERRRIDLTRHLLYACSKFILAIILHVNLYTLYQWHSLSAQQKQVLTVNEQKEVVHIQAVEPVTSIKLSEYDSPASTIRMDGRLGIPSEKYLTRSRST